MKFWNSIKNIVAKKPRSATEFIEKFIRDSKISRVQLEIIRNNEILVQTDSLKFTPSWFKLFNVDKNEFQDGFVIFFILDRNGIEKNQKFKNYQNSSLNLLEHDEMYEQTPIRTFAKFIKKTDDAVYLGKEIKEIIDSILKAKEINPQALFNIRYIKEE